MSESSECSERYPGLLNVRGRRTLRLKVKVLAHRCRNASRLDASELVLLEVFGSTVILTRRRECLRRGNTVHALSYRSRSLDMDLGCEWTVAPDDRYEGVGMKKQRGTRRTYLHRATQVRHQR